MDVELDGLGARLDRLPKRLHRVLRGHLRRPAVSDDEGHVPPGAPANTASTSSAASGGGSGTPRTIQ